MAWLRDHYDCLHNLDHVAHIEYEEVENGPGRWQLVTNTVQTEEGCNYYLTEPMDKHETELRMEAIARALQDGATFITLE